MSKHLFAVGLLMTAACNGCNSGIPPDAGASKVSLRLSFDREVYLEYEPILVECTLTNNQKENITPWARSTYPMYFKGTDERGKGFGLGRAGTGKPIRPLATILMAPGKSLRGWVDLRDYVWGTEPYTDPRTIVDSSSPGYRAPPIPPFSRTGKFTLKGIYDSTIYEGVDGVWAGRIESGTVSFRVVAGRGEDAKAVKLIQETISKSKGPDEDLSNYYLHPDAEGILQQEDLCRRLLEKTRSARFAASAHFYLGKLTLDNIKHWRVPPKIDNKANEAFLQYHNEAVRYFQACIDSDSASPYLRGLARLYLLQAKMEGDPKITPEQIKEMAEGLIKDYPDSYMSQEAQKILEKVKKE